ncbi:hypothetical protein PV11_02250 [Exophiala sideris]|uniref:Peptidase S9 prolyl oligopeptidase catalytic domain-containing protein n=1 Tax=Exophiala sideris TaxID=1016849 RepID=A0A0D1XF00_9EURO|nr:hypothetical protein PV11_02250 [Exophiala sideris]
MGMTVEESIEAPYGTWESPISIDLVSSSAVRFDRVEVNETTGKVYLAESRPLENGRICIVEFDKDTAKSLDILPTQYNAKSLVHGYGGAAFTVDQTSGLIVFVDSSTNGILSLDPSLGDVRTLLAPTEDLFFGDFDINRKEPSWILAIQEDHRVKPIANSVVAINVSTKEVVTLAQGADFYTHPRFSPDGNMVCWLQWNFPHMPWDSVELHLAHFKDGSISEERVIAGGQGEVSVQQPRWNPNGTLLYCSDATGYWQLYQYDPASEKNILIKLPGLEQAEFAYAEVFLGSNTYACLTSNLVVAMYVRQGEYAVCLIDLEHSTYRDVDDTCAGTNIQTDSLRRISETEFVTIAAREDEPMTLKAHRVADSDSAMVSRTLSSSIPLEKLPTTKCFSKPQFMTFPRIGSEEGGESHAIFWPPQNPSYHAPAEFLPPLIVSVHGGPVHDAMASLSLDIQFWTSRGYAWVEVNYAGSTGYGRAYRELLKGNWGVVDVDDIVSCVKYLASQAMVDPSRIGIRGGSAGGYSVLQCMVKHPDTWAGGVSLYGVSCLSSLEKCTHKFESRYLEGLLLPRSAVSEEEKQRIYRERSPLYHAEKIRAPILLLQGKEDIVVPPDQATMMETAIKGSLQLEGKADPESMVKVVIFDGEGHGFSKTDTLRRQKVEELSWWSMTLTSG